MFLIPRCRSVNRMQTAFCSYQELSLIHISGLKHASGDYVATMDVDLQDPPGLLPEMYRILKEEPYDSVATVSYTHLDVYKRQGLSYASEYMKGSPLCYQITMSTEECERSELAMDAIRRL